MCDCRVSKSLGTIVVIRGGAVRTTWAITIVSTIGRIVVRAFTLCTTFTFVWRRFFRSGAVQRIKVLVDDLFDVSFLGRVISWVFTCEQSTLEELFLLFNRSKLFGQAWCS